MPSSGRVFFVKAHGDSMSPLIKQESLVMIRKQSIVENGEISAVLLNDNTEVTLKRFRKEKDVVLLESINENYSTYIVSKEETILVLGKAIKVINEL